MEGTCRALTKGGKPCSAKATKTSEYCVTHQRLLTKKEPLHAPPPVKQTADIDTEKLKKLNECAEFILDQLFPEEAHEYRIASSDSGIEDIGIYIMGLLNRLYKQADYYNPDLEPEWEKRVVGYTDKLKCANCQRIIDHPRNLKQRFCSNICAKEYSDATTTGVVYPPEKDYGPETKSDELSWEREQKRIYG